VTGQQGEPQIGANTDWLSAIVGCRPQQGRGTPAEVAEQVDGFAGQLLAANGGREAVGETIWLILGIVMAIAVVGVVLVAAIAWLLDSSEGLGLLLLFATPVLLFTALMIWLSGEDGLAGLFLVLGCVAPIMGLAFLWLDEKFN
jgi:hypothetical protein